MKVPFFTVDTSTVDDKRSETIIICGSYTYSWQLYVFITQVIIYSDRPAQCSSLINNHNNRQAQTSTDKPDKNPISTDKHSQAQTSME